jgi:peptidoglycan DL-endopeptidase CwlO
VTNRPLPGRRSSPATGTIRRSIRRTAPAVILLCFAAALAATPAVGDPSIAAKQAEAQSVMGQVQQLDSSLERVIQAYDLATVKLNKVRADFKANHAQLQIAKQSLKRAQSALSARLVSLYTSDGQSDSLEVLLGASSLDDLVNRFNTANRISSQDSQVLGQVTHLDTEVKAREARLKHAKAEAAALVSERASEKASIEGQLAARRALLSSIRGQIAHLQAQEAARQAELRRELQARIVAQQQQAPAQALASTVAPVASSNPSSSVSSGPAPPPTHSSVVAIAEQYLGVPYRWGGASPSGFDCSGLVMYVFAQVGVSLPHSSYAQYGMGSPVSRDQLQPGDLVFFDGLGHVGIYVGGGSFIHAPHTGDVVRISSLSGWYASSYVGARRI